MVGQMPKILELTTFTNHTEILCRCKSCEERLFYILYANKEHFAYFLILQVKELVFYHLLFPDAEIVNTCSQSGLTCRGAKRGKMELEDKIHPDC